MDRYLLSQIAGKILRAKDVQNLDPIPFSRMILATKGYVHLRQYIAVSNEIANKPAAIAEVWQGGWVVPCPFCAGLEYGDPDQPLFLCCSCWNTEVGGKLVSVRYPAPTTIAAIESELLKRPQGKQRGWLKNETLKHLREENKQLGVA